MESAMDSQSSVQSEDANGDGKEDEALLLRAQELMAKITSSQTNPSTNVLHALASILEKQESRYVQETGYSSSNNFRSSHIIGRLGNLIQENDEFFELISSKFLLENRYPGSIRAAAARLLLSCSVTWVFPHVFEDAVVETIKHWILDDNVKVCGDNCNESLDMRRNKPTDSNMLRTYATGLLAVCLAGARGGQVVEDVLTSGLPAKLMHYLRTRVLGETNANKKDASYSTEGKHASGATYMRGREENRGRFRQVLDDTQLDGQRIGNEGLLDDQGATDALKEVVATWEADVDGVGEGRQQSEDLHDGKAQYSDRDGTNIRSTREEDAGENTRDDSSRRRANRGLTTIKGKGGNSDRVTENERILMSSGTGLQLGQERSVRDGNLLKNSENMIAPDAKKYSSETDADAFVVEGDDDDYCFSECKIGTKDISDLIKRATKAADAEARTANASAEAIKAACDAAAELVKTAALDALKSTNDEEASVLAASNAASTVVDAAIATEILRSSSYVNEDPMSSKARRPETDEGLEELFFLDSESLALMREKYCIKCLDILGEYVEVLGPILYEKGVDVCLAFLQRSAKQEASEILILVPDMLKLICALAAHRKFAALFVDRGGMQKLLTVQRVSQTFYGLSLCLLTIGSLQGIMERVCALPSDVVHQMVELALQLLECPEDDMARKNAAIFFTASFVFRAVLESFDAQEGLPKLLNLLHGAASARSGVNSGAIGSSLRNDRSSAEVLTALEKQVAYHTCIALRQYFRAHLLLLVDSLRPNKNQRSVARNIPSARTAYKPLDISNEAMDAIFLLIQRDRKLGPPFVRARWAAVDKFLGSNGHITMLELCQAPPVDRYLHDLAQYALGVLHLVTLVPYSRKLIVSATLSSERVGMAVILDAASGAGYVDPEVIHPALNVLVNLVCPPPSISNKPLVLGQGQQSVSVQTLNGPTSESREKHTEGNILDQTAPLLIQNVSGEHLGEPTLVERRGSAVLGIPYLSSSSQAAVPTIASGVVGNRRINLGPRAGCAGVAAQLEKGYHEAREAVRANNGIKVLLHLLQPRIFTPPVALDCLRALACRVLLGLARDDTIANILTKLQVGKKLSELIRDTGSQVPGIGTEQGRWQAELAQVAIELIAIVTNSGRASTLAATDAATPTLRRIERAAIAAATPITYHHRELLLLIHEHLQASGLTTTAASLLKEAQLTPLPSVGAPAPILHQATVQEKSLIRLQWPSGRTSFGFLSNTSKIMPRDEGLGLTSDSTLSCSRRKPLTFSSKLTQAKNQPPSTTDKISSALKSPSVSDLPLVKTPAVSPLKRKLMESKDTTFATPVKRLSTGELGCQSRICQTPSNPLKSGPSMDATGLFLTSSTQQIPYTQPTPGTCFVNNLNDMQYHSSPVGQTTSSGFQLSEQHASNTDRVTLDALVVQYLKHQHRQCPAPITTLPPLSLLHPHVCPEPSQSIDAPTNVTARLSMHELRNQYDGAHGHCRDRQFVYSRFRPWRTCRDGTSLLTCIAFLGDSSRIVTGSHSGELKIFESDSGNVFESHMCHQSPVTLVQSAMCGGTQLVLSSSTHDVGLWDPSSFSGGPLHSFEGCKAARLGNLGALFAALSSESSRREVLLYDIQTYALDLKLTDGSFPGPSGPVRGHTQSLIHFSPSDTMLLWNGVLWDRRSSGPVRCFDQFTDYGGGGFHPAGNEVIINSEVWDLRKFKLLRSVPSLDQTAISFSAGGDVIYAILRRNLEDITSAVNTRRSKHPLFAAFRTIDAINYSDISTVPVDRCVLDFAAEPMDSFVGVVAMDDPEQLFSSARLYEVGRRRPTDDDSDPDDGAQTDEEDDDDDDSEAEEDQLMLSPDSDSDESEDVADVIDGDGDGDDDDSDDEMDGDADLPIDDTEFGDGASILEIGMEGEDDENDSEVESLSSEDEGRYVDFGF